MGAHLTKDEFRDKVFMCLMDAVEEDDKQRASDIESYAKFFFEDDHITIRKAKFAIRLRDELNKRMSHV